ncbi:MAG TPA: hypothetical protein VFP65_10125, partial [Anaeromyxobacteraceae bacterium]|nr:hypothetical protein [Anaeromyxobacteraceae bacterium]
GERACDNAWFAFELPGVPTQQGRQLALVVEATAASGGISLYCQPAGWPRGAGRSGSLVGIDLAYRTWMAPGGAEGRTGGASDDVSVLRADLARSARELRELTQRLNVAEARLAVLATPRPRLWARVRQLAPWRGVHHAANGRAAVPAPPPPSLPYRAMRRIVAWARAGADDAEVETLIQDIQGSLPYRAARRAYRGLRRR